MRSVSHQDSCTVINCELVQWMEPGIKQIKPVPLDRLLLDPENPRLPEEYQNRSQVELLAYLNEHDVLDELIDSFLANGFFENEPILVIPAQGELAQGGDWIVVEGNRRTAALKRLLGDEAAVEAGLDVDKSTIDVDRIRIAELQLVPAFELEGRHEVSRYLGFRHISGLKTWGSEAKARYLWLQVEGAAAAGAKAPFFTVGRQVGSNTPGVRTAYNAYNLLRAGNSLVSGDLVGYVRREKFGVWTRLLGTANVPLFLGLPEKGAADYESVKARADYLVPDCLAEVLGDLKPARGKRRAVLNDSRDATDYSDVLAEPRALAAKREYANLSLAVQIVEQGQLGARLRSILDTLELLLQDVPRLDRPNMTDVAMAQEVSRTARSVLGAIQAQTEDEDE